MAANGYQRQLTMSGFAKNSCKSRTKKEEGSELSKFFIQGKWMSDSQCDVGY